MPIHNPALVESDKGPHSQAIKRLLLIKTALRKFCGVTVGLDFVGLIAVVNVARVARNALFESCVAVVLMSPKGLLTRGSNPETEYYSEVLESVFCKAGCIFLRNVKITTAYPGAPDC